MIQGMSEKWEEDDEKWKLENHRIWNWKLKKNWKFEKWEDDDGKVKIGWLMSFEWTERQEDKNQSCGDIVYCVSCLTRTAKGLWNGQGHTWPNLTRFCPVWSWLFQEGPRAITFSWSKSTSNELRWTTFWLQDKKRQTNTKRTKPSEICLCLALKTP